jgi:abortive infection bacteriophage resistance protein
MTIDDASALPYLTQVGGYRMKGCWYQWLDPASKTFRQGVHFDHAIERYAFDRALRRITGDVLERIELLVRASISNVMSQREGPHWFTKDALFQAPRAAAHGRPKKSLHILVKEEIERMKHRPFKTLIFLRHGCTHFLS